ncbi:fimbrial protein, partial [Vibrio azureus]
IILLFSIIVPFNLLAKIVTTTVIVKGRVVVPSCDINGSSTHFEEKVTLGDYTGEQVIRSQTDKVEVPISVECLSGTPRSVTFKFAPSNGYSIKDNTLLSTNLNGLAIDLKWKKDGQYVLSGANDRTFYFGNGVTELDASLIAQLKTLRNYDLNTIQYGNFTSSLAVDVSYN